MCVCVCVCVCGRIYYYYFISFRRTDELYSVQRRPGLLRSQPIQRYNRTDMNTSQLQCIISCDPVLRDRVLGVFAADHLPQTLPPQACGFIVNTDLSSQPGTHWLAFFIRDKTVECFDSYGQHPGVYNPLFSRWIRRHADRVYINHTRLQSDTSNVCGLYCVYFLRQRLLGHSMPQIVERFSTSNPEANDGHILHMFRQSYGHCVQNDCIYNQTCTPRTCRL